MQKAKKTGGGTIRLKVPKLPKRQIANKPNILNPKKLFI